MTTPSSFSSSPSVLRVLINDFAKTRMKRQRKHYIWIGDGYYDGMKPQSVYVPGKLQWDYTVLWSLILELKFESQKYFLQLRDLCSCRLWNFPVSFVVPSYELLSSQYLCSYFSSFRQYLHFLDRFRVPQNNSVYRKAC